MWLTVKIDDTATSVAYRTDGKPLDIGDGYFIRETKVLVGRNADLDFNIEIRIGFDSETRKLVAGALTIKSHNESASGVTSEVLREIPVGMLVRYAKDAVFRLDGEGNTVGAWPSGDERDDVMTRGDRDEILRLVARVYRVAYLINVPPAKHVETIFELSRATAGRWVAEARRKGYLSETTPGKAGV